jgi:hypothetical protein
MRRPSCPEPCPAKKSVLRSKSLAPELIRLLEDLFSVLSSATRIRILHLLGRKHERTVSDLARSLGMKMAAVSNQLRLMVDKGILGCRSEGLFAHYCIVDPCVPQILDTGACLALDSLKRSRRRTRQ